MIRTQTLFIILAVSIFNLVEEVESVAQSNHAELIEQLSDAELRERVGAIRGLAIGVIRGIATADQRLVTLVELKKLTRDNDPVIRLTAHTELLKISAAEDDVELSRFAIQACNDENINVRRGILKFFRTYYAGRYAYGKIHEPLLLEKIEDEDLATRYHAGATLHSWGISNEKIINIMLDSLDLGSYRAASLHSLMVNEKDRQKLIELLMKRLKNSEHNAGVYINTVSMIVPEAKQQLTALLEFYESKSESVRAAVIDAIGRLLTEEEKSIAVLTRAVHDESPVIRRLVLSTLIRFEPDKSLLKKFLLKLLQDQDKKVGLAASDALAWFENDFEMIRPELENILGGDNPEHANAVMNGCLTCGPMSASLGPAVAQRLRDGNMEQQVRACWALEEMEVDRKLFLEAADHALSNNQLDVSALAAILDAMSRFATAKDDCRKWFEKYLNDDNPTIRVSCTIGLKNYPAVELIERVILQPRSKQRKPTGRIDNIDNAVVSFLEATGDSGMATLVSFLDHAEPRARGRAMLALSKKQQVTDAAREKMVAALESDDIFERTCAAFAVARTSELNAATLEKIFNVSNPSDRQQTVRILELLASLGEKAAPITPRMAYLMDGGYRNRFATDAMKNLVALGEYAAPATDMLLSEPFNIRKIECLAAIGPAANKAETKLRQTVKEMDAKIGQTSLLRIADLYRRTRVAAAIALWRVCGDATEARRVLGEELDQKSRMALTALHSFKAVDEELLGKVTSMLPESDAINALGSLGKPAQPAVVELKKIAAAGDSDLSFEANRALWNITDDPIFAIEIVKRILARNRFELVEIRVDDRQKIWEALRFLNSRRNVDGVEMLLNQIQIGRFPNLRSFVRQLKDPDSAS